MNNNYTIFVKKTFEDGYIVYHICFIYQLFIIIFIVANKTSDFARFGNVFYHIA